jgi:hypothetical protein
VRDRREAVTPSNSSHPFLYLGCFYLDRAAAPPAHKVMVMIVGITSSVKSLAFGGSNDVDLPCLGQCLKVSINGRQPHARARPAQLVVQLLGAEEATGALEGGKDCRPLPGDPSYLGSRHANSSIHQ